jgi:hypothetical protein
MCPARDQGIARDPLVHLKSIMQKRRNIFLYSQSTSSVYAMTLCNVVFFTVFETTALFEVLILLGCSAM